MTSKPTASLSDDVWTEIDAGLKLGDVVILPTETVYGIAARADIPDAISKVYALKGRDFDKPLAVCVKDMVQAERLAVFDKTSRRLANKFWPGPLTLVLNAAENTLIDPRALGNIGDVKTIALRCPDADWTKHLDHPLALTSANRSGERDALSFDDASSALGEKVTLGIKTEAPLSGAPSTIIRVENNDIKILRHGELCLEDMTP